MTLMKGVIENGQYALDGQTTIGPISMANYKKMSID